MKSLFLILCLWVAIAIAQNTSDDAAQVNTAEDVQPQTADDAVVPETATSSAAADTTGPSVIDETTAIDTSATESIYPTEETTASSASSVSVTTVPITVTPTYPATVTTGGTIESTVLPETSVNTLTEGSVDTQTVSPTGTAAPVTTATGTDATAELIFPTGAQAGTTVIIGGSTAAVATISATLAPSQAVAVYMLTSCQNTVTCQTGTTLRLTNGKALSCLNVYFSTTRSSTTCLQSYCCTESGSTSGSTSGTPAVVVTSCAAKGVTCPTGYQLAYDSEQQSVPCVVSNSSKFKQNTCTVSNCCVRTRYRTTVTKYISATKTTAASATATATVVRCHKHIQCRVYKADHDVGGVKQCSLTESTTVDKCTVKNCCAS